ncbi:ATP:cob(I)alamin adenosyltransferase [Persicirhabdus sediminis]|uniref:Corrinoid adenosyltransferase n=1 Tax=Persicirhabdus sediminis TaxID=454144 RepID=A0A8J7MFR8_9BACT|nr:ATP:cob(I)alamin adenosyltransferase [Persicirhabdus sediminis]MBK1792207.1 ATP:cob(I)alamin adenosyltransferase [Persicirhabdus sediminis]
MSVITKRGDQGLTDTMFGGRVPKNSPNVVASGVVDELNACVGLARTTAGMPEAVIAILHQIQEKLIGLMGEISVDPEAREKYYEKGYLRIVSEDIGWLENLASEMETKFQGWVKPGENGSHPAAHLDHCRTVCRRAEITAWSLGDGAPEFGPLFLNRLSDVFWLLSREVEKAK